MSKNEESQSRSSRKTATYPDLDLSVPVENQGVSAGKDCFSNMWDAVDRSCRQCADTEICGIMFRKNQREKVVEMEKVQKYLDLSELHNLTHEQVEKWIIAGSDTTEKLFDKIAKESRNTDDEAIVNLIKRVFEDKGYKSKQGKIIKA
jgi:hypothetical protein